MKISISINDELLRKIDEYSKENFLTRSGFLSLAANQYILQQEAMSTMKSLRSAVEKVSETGEMDEQSEADMKKFMELASMIGQ